VADFYSEMQGVATELLTQFNQGTMTYKSITPATPFEPAVDTVVPFKGTATGVAFKYRNDLVTSSDIEITAAVFSPAPKPNGTVTIDGTERQILSVMAIPAAGTPSIYKIFVKG
jgi:hypothetical protein